MSCKRQGPEEGLLGMTTPLNTGKEYTKFEYWVILFLAVRGQSLGHIATVLRRTEECIERAWDRLCHNASAYRGVKEYDLPTPDCAPLPYLNHYAKEYIRIQFDCGLASANELARRLGCDPELIRDYLDEVNEEEDDEVIVRKGTRTSAGDDEEPDVTDDGEDTRPSMNVDQFVNLKDTIKQVVRETVREELKNARRKK